MTNHGLANVMMHETERRMAGRYVERHGLVTSYDPKTYLAKVTFQPEGQESGWLPIETGHIGAGYGIAVGLQPGSGSGIKGQQKGDDNQNSSTGQATGDQVIVRYQEGDIESGKIVQRVHSDQDKPPEVQSGEMVIWTKFKKDENPGPDAAEEGQPQSKGQQLWWRKDGSIEMTDGNGASIMMDGKGNITHKCKDYTVDASGTHTVKIGKDKKVEIKGKRTDNVKESWVAKAKSGVWAWLISGSDISD